MALEEVAVGCHIALSTVSIQVVKKTIMFIPPACSKEELEAVLVQMPTINQSLQVRHNPNIPRLGIRRRCPTDLNQTSHLP